MTYNDLHPDFYQESEQEAKISLHHVSSPMPQPLTDWLSRVLERIRFSKTESQQQTGEQNEY